MHHDDHIFGEKKSWLFVEMMGYGGMLGICRYVKRTLQACHFFSRAWPAPTDPHRPMQTPMWERAMPAKKLGFKPHDVDVAQVQRQSHLFKTIKPC
jgi:hypothetical protein